MVGKPLGGHIAFGNR